jgi:folylpolyglutamate synthase/dihydropteroate synthase
VIYKYRLARPLSDYKLNLKGIADVAHNPAGLNALINKISKGKKFEKLHVVFGAVKGKDLDHVTFYLLQLLLPM